MARERVRFRRKETPAMKRTITLLVAPTAHGAALGLPAFSAIRNPAADRSRPGIAFSGEGAPLLLASGDDDDDEGGCRRAARSPAPVGTVASPQNGFSGTTPRRASR
jgi:hypothetical protein